MNKHSLTPKQAVKLHCFHCVCNDPVHPTKEDKNKIRTCKVIDCPFCGMLYSKGKVSCKLIRKYCVEFCMSSNDGLVYKYVNECDGTDCNGFLFPFKFGKNPNFQLSIQEKERRKRIAIKNLTRINK